MFGDHPVEVCARVVALHEEGYSYSVIAKKEGVPRSSVGKIVLRFKKYGVYTSMRKGGNHTKMKPSQIKKMDSLWQSKPHLSSSAVQKKLKLPVTPRQVSNIASKTLAYVSVKPKPIPALTVKMKRDRLEYARKCKNMSTNVWWSFDEKPMYLGRVMGKVRKKRGEPTPECEYDTKYAPRLAVIAGFSREGKSTMRFNDGGGMTADAYIVPLRVMLPSVKRCYRKGTPITFVHDKARSHIAKVTQEYIEGHLPPRSVVVLNPTKSPDFQPIEQYWHSMEERVSRKRPKNLAELKKYILKDWNDLTLEEIGKYFDKMEKNFKVVASHNGEFSGDPASIRKRTH